MRIIKKNISKSFLFVCLGLFIATIAFASMRSRLNPPTPPGRPEATDIWEDRCTLKYRAPISNGGSVVTDYHIESRYDTEDRWVPKGTSKGLHFTVSALKGGAIVTFRVYAENAVGLSNPSLESNPIKLEGPY